MRFKIQIKAITGNNPVVYSCNSYKISEGFLIFKDKFEKQIMIASERILQITEVDE